MHPNQKGKLGSGIQGAGMGAVTNRGENMLARKMAKYLKPIEELLIWTYRDELPKRPTAAFSPWERMITLGTVVDDSRIPDEPGIVTDAPVHPDAATLAVEVDRLPDMTVVWDRLGPQLMGDLLPYAPVGHPTLARMQFQTSAIVKLHARTATTPLWDLGPIRLVRVNGANGKPVVSGITAGGRYAEGADCPLRLEFVRHRISSRLGDPHNAGLEIAHARAEYHVWRTALTAIAECWIGQDYMPLPPAVPAMPWASDMRKSRILRVVS